MKKIIDHLKTILPAEKLIVTGSFALAQYGLVEEHKVHDLDIILVNPEETTFVILERLMNDNPAKTKPLLPLRDAKVEKASKPVRDSGLRAIFMQDGVQVDIFIINYKDKVCVIDDIPCASLKHIVAEKEKASRIKDWLQLRDMSRRFYKPEDFLNVLNGDWRETLKEEY
jgi:hypothetical protein